MRFEFKFYKHWPHFGLGFGFETSETYCPAAGLLQPESCHTFRAHFFFWSIAIHYWPER